jgi:hypothetical protein
VKNVTMRETIITYRTLQHHSKMVVNHKKYFEISDFQLILVSFVKKSQNYSSSVWLLIFINVSSIGSMQSRP